MQLGKGCVVKCMQQDTFSMMCQSKKYGPCLLDLLQSSHT